MQPLIIPASGPNIAETSPNKLCMEIHTIKYRLGIAWTGAVQASEGLIQDCISVFRIAMYLYGR